MNAQHVEQITVGLDYYGAVVSMTAMNVKTVTTRKTGKLCLSANLKRTDDEIEKTASILDGLFNTCNK